MPSYSTFNAMDEWIHETIFVLGLEETLKCGVELLTTEMSDEEFEALLRFVLGHCAVSRPYAANIERRRNKKC